MQQTRELLALSLSILLLVGSCQERNDSDTVENRLLERFNILEQHFPDWVMQPVGSEANPRLYKEAFGSACLARDAETMEKVGEVLQPTTPGRLSLELKYHGRFRDIIGSREELLASDFLTPEIVKFLESDGRFAYLDLQSGNLDRAASDYESSLRLDKFLPTIERDRLLNEFKRVFTDLFVKVDQTPIYYVAAFDERACAAGTDIAGNLTSRREPFQEQLMYDPDAQRWLINSKALFLYERCDPSMSQRREGVEPSSSSVVGTPAAKMDIELTSMTPDAAFDLDQKLVVIASIVPSFDTEDLKPRLDVRPEISLRNVCTGETINALADWRESIVRD